MRHRIVDGLIAALAAGVVVVAAAQEAAWRVAGWAAERVLRAIDGVGPVDRR